MPEPCERPACDAQRGPALTGQQQHRFPRCPSPRGIRETTAEGNIYEFQERPVRDPDQPAGREKSGKFLRIENLGHHRGGGEYLVVEIAGKEVKARASKVKAA